MNGSGAPCPHLVLVGLMGTGKSTVGRRIAHKLGWEFLDTDDEVCRTTGRTIRQIFEEQGEAEFRRIEHQVFSQALSSTRPHVIAAAGGVVVRPDNRELLATVPVVVWLTAPLSVLLERIGARSSKAEGHRPLIDGDPATRLQKLYSEREALYREVSTIEIDVSGSDIAEVIDRILVATGLEANP